MRLRSGKFYTDSDSPAEVLVLVHDLLKMQGKPNVQQQNLNSDRKFLENFIKRNPFPTNRDSNDFKTDITDMGRQALEEWKTHLPPKEFLNWKARGYPPEAPAPTNIGNMDRWKSSVR
ncbi:uncharacterized protein [Physcomitrium patens]